MRKEMKFPRATCIAKGRMMPVGAEPGTQRDAVATCVILGAGSTRLLRCRMNSSREVSMDGRRRGFESLSTMTSGRGVLLYDCAHVAAASGDDRLRRPSFRRRRLPGVEEAGPALRPV